MSPPLSAPNRGEQLTVVVAPRSAVQLQHEAVVDAHGGHLDQHLGPEQLGVCGLGSARPDPREEGLDLGRAEVRGRCRRVAVVARRGSGLDEPLPPGTERGQVALPAGGVLTGRLGEAIQVLDEVGTVGIDHVVRAEGGHDPALPPTGRDLRVRLERIERRVGGGQELDAEAFVERAWPEGVVGERRHDLVVHLVRGLGTEGDRHPEHLGEGVVEPQLRGRGPEQVVVVGEGLPDPPAVRLHLHAVASRHAEAFERHALAVQHAEQVVVPGHQLAGRVPDDPVVREQ